MHKEKLLKIEGLRIRIGNSFPVNGADLEISSGEFVSLVGASGSGKTLTALASIGLLPSEASITAGSIQLKGRELTGLSDKEWREVRGREIAMIFQEPMTSLNPVMTIGAQLTEAIRIGMRTARKETVTAAVDALKAVQMPEPSLRMKSYPHQLSGGLRQRAMIAMALSCQPSLLIADEPTTALDVTVQAGIVRLLQKIRHERGLAILLITHDIALAAEATDRIVVLQDGQTVESGPADRIIGEPIHPYTVSLIQHCRNREIPLRKERN